MMGPCVSMGTGSPKAALSLPAQAPAQTSATGAVTVVPSFAVTRKSSASLWMSTTSQFSSTVAPALRAARPNAGAAKRGLAWPSFGENEPAITSGPRNGKRLRTSAWLRISRSSPQGRASAAYFSMVATLFSSYATRMWPVTMNSASCPINSGSRPQMSRERCASGSCGRNRPCRRTLAKLTPLACWPTRPRSSSTTERPRLRRKKALAAPTMPPPTITTSAASCLLLIRHLRRLSRTWGRA